MDDKKSQVEFGVNLGAAAVEGVIGEGGSLENIQVAEVIDKGVITVDPGATLRISGDVTAKNLIICEGSSVVFEAGLTVALDELGRVKRVEELTVVGSQEELLDFMNSGE